MQLKYTQIEIPTCDVPLTVTALVITGVSITDFYKHADKIWNFIYTHNHHVLRPFYRECKKAGVCNYHINEENYDPEQFPTVVFKSSWEDHKPYIEILQRELGLVIEDLPT